LGYWTGEKNLSANKQSSNSNTKYEQETMEDVASYPILPIPERFISKAAAEHYQIRTAVNPKDGKTPIAHYFPYTIDGEIVGYKKRDLTIPKVAPFHFSTVGFQSAKCDVFGAMSSNKTGGKKLFITEGEYDCAATWSVLKEKYPQGNPTV